MVANDDGDIKQKNKPRVSKLTIILAVVTLLAIGAGGYFYIQYQSATNERSANAKIVERIAQSVELPDETPVFITVVEKEKLSNKQLAAKVDNGDVMLIFSKAKRLIIYRPSIAKVADILGFSDEKELPHK